MTRTRCPVPADRRARPLLLAATALALCVAPAAADEPALRHSEVVFMYAADTEVYEAYGATFTAWGGASTPEEVKRHHEAGVRCTGSMWCLTAGARRLHEDAELREAVARDIAGDPIEVPWLFDHTHEGQRTWFGCTNHPAFREHLRAEVRRVMAGGADGLHVDDHLGTAQTADHLGGGLCDHCIERFREYLAEHADERELRDADIDDLESFDYRDLIRQHADTRERYIEVQWQVPLMDRFVRFHREAAADFVGELHEVAEETVGRPVLLSANAWIGSDRHHDVVPHLTHIVCEVPQSAAEGTGDLDTAIRTYRAATAFGKPLAGTASGHDWAHVAEAGQHELIRFWIALAYAHGQRFMVPHRQWCFNEEKGTHWHTFPIDEFAPMYHFIRDRAEYFDEFEAADDVEVDAPENVLATVRRKDGRTAIHILNLDYDADPDRMRPQQDVPITLPAALATNAERARLLTYDADPRTADIQITGDHARIRLPDLRLWTLIALE